MNIALFSGFHLSRIWQPLGMLTSYVPFIREEDHPVFRRLAPGDPDFPASYEKWLQWRTEYRASEQGRGHRVVDVEVRPAEFQQWCRGNIPNRLALLNFGAHG